MNKFKHKSPSISPHPISLDRCACCLSRPKRTGATSVFTPKDGSAPIPYTLCPRCVKRVTGGNKKAIAAIESHLMDAAE